MIFYLNTEYLPHAEYGPFKFDEQGRIPMFQTIIQKVIYRNTNAKNIGYFYRDITKFDKSKNNSLSAQALVVITKDDLKTYIKAFPDSIQDFVQFLGHELNLDEILSFLKTKSFKQTLFIDSSLNSKERAYIRINFPNTTISYIDNIFDLDSRNDNYFSGLDRKAIKGLNYLNKSIKKVKKSNR